MEEAQKTTKDVKSYTRMNFRSDIQNVGYFPRLTKVNNVITWDGRNMSDSSGPKKDSTTGKTPTQLTAQVLINAGMSPIGNFVKVNPGMPTPNQILEITFDMVAPKMEHETEVGSNALWTNDPRVGLMVKPGDCPVSVISAVLSGQSLLGIVHSGREQADQMLPKKFIEFLLSLGCDLQDIHIGTAPFIENYYIQTADEDRCLNNKELWNRYGVLERKREKTYLNLGKFVLLQFIEAGILPYNIEHYSIDTFNAAKGGHGASHRLSSYLGNRDMDRRFMVAAQMIVNSI